MNKRLSSVLSVAVAASLVPSVTFAEATVAQPVTTRCAAVVVTANEQQARLMVVRDRQLGALGRVNRRLANLIDQADSQGHNLATIKADRAELDRRITNLSAAYATLLSAVAATGAQCGASTSVAGAQDALVVARDQVAGLETWYVGQLGVHLGDLAARE